MPSNIQTVFDDALQKADKWLDEVQSQISAEDPQNAYRALRAVLIALRDRLPVEEATDLGAQLPLVIRGIYYEEWNPAKTPTRERTKESFLQNISDILRLSPTVDPENAARAVFRVLAQHVTAGELRHVKSNLPSEIQELWP